MRNTVIDQDQPTKPSHAVWAFSVLCFVVGLAWLNEFVRDGYITVGKYPPVPQYSGSLAITAIAFSLGFGFFGLVLSIRAWRMYRKRLSSEDEKGYKVAVPNERQ